MDNKANDNVKQQATVATQPLFVIKDNSVLALAITQVMEKAKALRNERGNYTVEYFCEDIVADAVTAFNRYLDSNEDRKNREAFTKAMNAMETPDVSNPNALKVYVEKVDALKRKYRQGSYKAEV